MTCAKSQQVTELGFEPGLPDSRALTLTAMSKASAPRRQEGNATAEPAGKALRSEVRMNSNADEVEDTSRKR